MNWPNIADPIFALESRDFFAPETAIAKDGRRVMWSWLRIQNIKNSSRRWSMYFNESSWATKWV